MRSRGPLKPADAVAEFDSATAMLAATARALRGEPFPRLGRGRSAALLAEAAGRLPLPLRQRAYAVSGAMEAIPAERLASVDAEDVRAWAVDQYPQRTYPAVALGSSNGAAVHLYAALGIPWLPQTFLLPVRARFDPDDAQAALDFGARTAGPFLDANPTVALHQMHDPNQDRLMAAHMAYFRVKQLSLGAAYERFLTQVLAPGAPILVVRDRSRWPVTRVRDRHVFQFGGQGGATVQEYLHGGPRVAAFLAGQRASIDRWHPPAPDECAPEAEWGLAPELLTDVCGWASRHGHPVHEISVDAPQDLSAPVADIYRRWYAGQGRPADRLLVESFILLDAVETVRAGYVPYWTMFATEPSLAELSGYLDRTGFEEIRIGLFPHGVASIGLADTDAWRRQCTRASRYGDLLGVDARRYPADFAALVRYQPALSNLAPRHPSSADAPSMGGLSMEAVQHLLRPVAPPSAR